MINAQNLLKSAVARVGFSVVAAAVAFFMMPYLVEHLGERWYGVWVLVAGLVSNSYLLDLGMTAAVIRFVAKHLATGDSDSANEVVNTCLAIYTVLAVVVFMAALGLGAMAHLFVEDTAALGVIRATIILFGLQYAAEFPFKAFAGIISSCVRYDLLMLSRLVNLVLTNVAFVYLVSHGYGILALAVTVLLLDQLSNFLYFRIAKHLFPQLRISRAFFRKHLVRELFSYSTWAFVIQIANQCRFRIDSLVIGWILSAGAVTYYAVGARLVEYFVDFVYRATNMMTPLFTVYFFQNDMIELRKKYLLLTRVNAVLALFGGGIIVTLGQAFIVRWMGPTFEQSYPVMVILMIAMVTEVIGNYSDNILYAVSKHKYLAIINTIEAVLNLVLSIAFARRFGIAGVALGTAIPLLFFRLLVIPFYVGRFIDMPLWRYYRNLIPVTLFTLAYVAAFMVITRHVLGEPSYLAILVAGAASAPLYLALVPFVVFDNSERGQLLNLFPARIRRWAAPALGVPGPEQI